MYFILFSKTQENCQYSVKNLSALVVNAIMLVILKVIFSGIGRDVVTVLCLFFAAGHFAKAEQMNVLTQLHVANRQNVSMFTLGYPHPCESMLCVWVSYNRNENKRCVLYIVQNLRAH